MRGLVVGPMGIPVAGAEVAAIPAEEAGDPGRPAAGAGADAIPAISGEGGGARTDGIGAFEIAGLRAGSFRIAAGAPGYIRARSERFDLAAGGSRTVEIELEPEMAIAGKVVTAEGDPAFSGVYKMAAIRQAGGEWQMKLKISEARRKSTLPGVKQVWRLLDGNRQMIADWIELEEDRLVAADPETGRTEGVGTDRSSAPDFSQGVWGYHPFLTYQKSFYQQIEEARPLLALVFAEGHPTIELPSLKDLRARVQQQLQSLHPTMRRLLNPHIYKVSIGPRLKEVSEALREVS